ncbi:DUF1573 domain-containing protein [Seonamhaeicola sp. NFXS20]|uniref:DUF1573 domain-containing protein n=1 Tax=Seonamhaeicola sp. NFXS20 TaxID=2816959 RepID=UPI003B8E068C
MKQTVSTLLILLYIGITNQSQAQNLVKLENVASIEFESEIIDYGTIQQGASGLKTFTFTNTGDVPIIISEVKTSCGCTVPSYSKTPILPGDIGKIKINYNTKKLGNFTKTITVISNSKETQKTLKIKGVVVAAN